MALHGAAMLLNQGGYSGYEIGNSAVFDGSSDYLSRTFGSPTSQGVWTFSCWVRNCRLSGESVLFAADDCAIYFNGSTQSLRIYIDSGVSDSISSAANRDPASSYHVVVAYDGAASGTDKIKAWINGNQITDWSSDGRSSAPATCNFNENTRTHRIGRGDAVVTGYFDGYLSEARFIDGTAYSATDFGEFFNGGNKWRPKAVSGLTYGTNGFYLPFTQDTPNLGTDQSGNGNDWTENGSPVQSSDSPTKNIASINSVHHAAVNLTLSEGNTKVEGYSSGGAPRAALSNVPFDIEDQDGFYAECEILAMSDLGVGVVGADTHVGTSASDNLLVADTYQGVRKRGSGASFRFDYLVDGSNQGDFGIGTGTVGKRFQIFCRGGKVWLGYDGTWQLSGDPNSDTTPVQSGLTGLFFFGSHHYTTGDDCKWYFAENEWTHTPPAGAKEANAANLPEVTITDPGEYFNAVAYTGDGTAIGSGGNSITGVGFQSDFTWIKNRDDTNKHQIYDILRGTQKVIHSNQTLAESTESEGLNSFDSDGFTVGSNGGENTNTDNYISWNWKAGGSGVANTDGTISSTVSVNDDAGFSIVSYAGNSTSGATVGHGQSGVIELAIAKRLNAANTWYVQHSGLATASNQYLELNTTNAAQSNAGVWDGTEAGASVVTLGNNNATNGSGDEYIMYCFRSIPGFSKVFSFEGNGSSDGIFVYLGFRPKFILYRNADQTGNGWPIWDDVRSPYNGRTKYFTANTSNAENDLATREIDFLSNGFKTRGTSTEVNRSGNTFVGIAFAENPFGGSNLPLGLAS